MAIERLLDIMVRLRDPEHGCPWDRAQTWATIAPHTIEEAAELADAIERGDVAEVRDELGDLLFQVVFQSRIAEEQGLFGFADVAAAISDKLERRHPHVFAGESVTDTEQLGRAWEAAKAKERAARGGDPGALGGVALGLPALSRAAKLGKRAGQAGFDWPEPRGVLLKVREEIDELERELDGAADPPRVAEELGDLLFSLAQVARHLAVDPEAALRQASRKFERRFAVMERWLADQGRRPAEATPEELDRLWEQAKRELA